MSTGTNNENNLARGSDSLVSAGETRSACDRRSLKNGFAAIGFIGLLLCQDVAASLFTSAYLNIDRQELDPPGPNVSIFEDLQQSSSLDNSAIGVAINPSVSYVTPNAVARAREGVLKVGVNAEANIPGVTVLGSSGRAEARWEARPIIKIDGVATGEKAIIPAHMRFERSLGYQNNGYSTDTVYLDLATSRWACRLAMGPPALPVRPIPPPTLTGSVILSAGASASTRISRRRMEPSRSSLPPTDARRTPSRAIASAAP